MSNKSKRKRNRRKERRRKNISAKMLKFLGVNCAGLLSKIDSFANIIKEEQPTIFCLQETKLKKSNKITNESSKNFTIFELKRKNTGGGGLCVGVHKDLRSVLVAQGDDEVECLAIEDWRIFPFLL